MDTIYLQVRINHLVFQLCLIQLHWHSRVRAVGVLIGLPKRAQKCLLAPWQHLLLKKFVQSGLPLQPPSTKLRSLRASLA